MLDLNITILFQMVNFFIALYVLNILLIRPVRTMLRERRALMDNMAGETDAFEREATARLEGYEAELAHARHEAGLTREQARNAGLAAQQQTVQEATRKAQSLLVEAQATIIREAEATLTALQTKVKDLAGKLSNKLIS